MKNDIAKSITIEQLKQQYNLDSKKILSAIEQESNKLTKVENEMNNYIEVVTKEINSLQDQVDGNITTWFFSGIPSLENEPANDWETIADKDKHIGDLYYDKDTGYAYRFQLSDGVYSWQKLTDNDVTEALAIANSAKDTADSKRRTFLDTPTPPYDSGDIWVNNGKIFICQISRLAGDSYVNGDFIDELNYTDDTYAEEVNGKLTVLSGKVAVIETGVDEISQKVEENKYYTDSDGNKQLISSAMTQVTQDVDGLEIKVDNIQLKVLYTWIKYADDENGTNMSNSSTGKDYIGIANNKEISTASDNPTDYVWSRIKGDTGAKGEQGIQGEKGDKGEKGDTGEQGAQGIQGEKGDKGDKGDTGATGQKGEDGITYYTWIKYADSPTSGMSDSSTNKKYMGIAYNKTTSIESTNYSDYEWSLIKGEDGQDGQNGTNGQNGISIISIVNYYAINTSNTVAPTTGWNTTMPIKSSGEYLWVKELITFSDNSTEYTTAFVVTGDKGEQGEQGIQGEKGDKGDTGEKGEQGLQGLQGDKGEKGDTGEQGIQGEKGDKGDTGEKGADGADGKDAAIQSATEPEDTSMLWYDTVNNQLKQYNGTEWIVVNDFSDDIERLDNQFTNYFTKEQINELIINSESGLTNTFKSVGGNNLLKNSALYFKTGNEYDYWTGNAEKIVYSEAQSNTAIKLKNNSFKQSVSLANGEYTLSFKYERLNELGSASVKINNEETSFDEKGTFTKQLTVETNQIELEFNSTLDDSYIIYDLMLNTGTEASTWSQYQNEVHTDTVNISKGIEVEATENDTKATMNADGFNVINKNTQANVLKATDTGIETTDVKADKGTIGGMLVKKVQNQTWITGV